MSLAAKDALILYKEYFRSQLDAIIKSKEFEEYLFGYDFEERRIIKNNQLQIATSAAEYYIQQFGANLSDDEGIVRRQIKESIKNAIKKFR